MARLIYSIALLLLSPYLGFCQFVERVTFDVKDSANGYYLAIPPASHTIKGTVVLLCSFREPESMLPETRLHNVASGNDLLTIYASMGKKFFADSGAMARLNTILRHVVAKYGADTSAFVLAGFSNAGGIALRYTEHSQENPDAFPVHPKAVIGIASNVDLFGLWHWCEKTIKKHYFPPEVNDAKVLTDMMTRTLGTPYDKPENYKKFTPFNNAEEAPGNEQYLKNVAVRLYYDLDIDGQLTFRRNSLYDTDIPDATELIKRLMLAGNKKAEFVVSRQPGVRSNGIKSPTALSIVDETDCIQWVKRLLNILDPTNPLAWSAPYTFPVPDGWRIERTYSPPPFAPLFTLKGIEDIRFPPGWGDAGSEQYWSVGYLFWLDRGQTIDAGVLQDNIRIYFEGLIGRAVARDNIPAAKVVPTQVSIKKIKTEPGDLETWAGSISMLDYMAQKPITLNCMAHIKTGDKIHIPLFLEVSPKPFEHPIWHDLKQLKERFTN